MTRLTAGRLTSIVAGPSGAVDNRTFAYDALGRLTSRGETNAGLAESFCVRHALAAGSFGCAPPARRCRCRLPCLRLRMPTRIRRVPLVKTFSYNAIGNLTAKSDVGSYTYPAAGQPRPHGVLSVAGAVNASFTYDLRGNMTAGHGWTVAYTSYDKPASITRGSTTLAFEHDDALGRYKQVGPTGTLYYLADPASGAVAERQFLLAPSVAQIATGARDQRRRDLDHAPDAGGHPKAR